MWQDYAIAIVVLVFTLTTVPIIRDAIRLPPGTTIPMVIGAAILVVAYATLGLWYSVAVETLALMGWTILLMRTFKHV